MIIGVTGSLATGKSTVTAYLQSYLRAYRIDADRITHRLLLKKDTVYRRLISTFGKEILNRKGAIDRTSLADKVFQKKSSVEKLCGIVHPLVVTEIRNRIRRIYNKRRSAFIIIDGPLLIEAGLHRECDCIVVVTSSLTLQLERLRRRKGMRPVHAILRIRQQLPQFKKVRFADFIIANNGSLYDLKKMCKNVADKIKGLENKNKEDRR